MSLLWAITSTSRSSTHNRFARLSLAWVLCTLVWTASALNITQPVPGGTIDISFPYNVTWSWTEQDAIDHPLIRLQMTPTFELNSDVITTAGIATFWAAGSVVSAQSLEAASPVQLQLVNPDQYTEVWAFVGPIHLVNSENITAAPSSYLTTQYPATPLATSSASASTPTSQSTSLSDGAIAGIVIGAIAAVALVATCIAMCLLFNKRRVLYSNVAIDNHTGGQPSKPEIIHENKVGAVHGSENVDHGWGRVELPTTARGGYA